MIRHVVLRRFVDAATPEQIAAIERNTRALDSIDGIRSITAGPNLGLSPKDEGLRHVTLVDADDEAALRRFITDPRHVEAAAYSGPLTERAVIVDVELPD
jgi:hypothetical protein